MSRTLIQDRTQDDEDFLYLVRAAKESSWVGPEANELLQTAIPALIRRMFFDFGELEQEDILTRAWGIVNKTNLEGKTYPRSWLKEGLRRELVKALRAQRDLASEEQLGDPEWREERAFVGVRRDGTLTVRGPDERLLVRGRAADEYFASLPVAPDREETRVWEDLRNLLIQLFWPESIANEVVTILECRAEAGNVSIDETADELKCVPKGSRRPLVKFVFAPKGFLWALLKGVDPARALTLAVSAEDLADIMWKDTPLPQHQRPLVLSGTAH